MTGPNSPHPFFPLKKPPKFLPFLPFLTNLGYLLKKTKKKRAFEKRKKTRVRKKREKNARSKKWKPHVYVGRFFERASKKWFFSNARPVFQTRVRKNHFFERAFEKKKKNALFGVIQGVRGTHGRTTEEPRRTARGYTFFLLFSVSVTRRK